MNKKVGKLPLLKAEHISYLHGRCVSVVRSNLLPFTYKNECVIHLTTTTNYERAKLGLLSVVCWLDACLPIHPPVCPSTRLSIHLSVYPSVFSHTQHIIYRIFQPMGSVSWSPDDASFAYGGLDSLVHLHDFKVSIS